MAKCRSCKKEYDNHQYLHFKYCTRCGVKADFDYFSKSEPRMTIKEIKEQTVYLANICMIGYPFILIFLLIIYFKRNIVIFSIGTLIATPLFFIICQCFSNLAFIANKKSIDSFNWILLCLVTNFTCVSELIKTKTLNKVGKKSYSYNTKVFKPNSSNNESDDPDWRNWAPTHAEGSYVNGTSSGSYEACPKCGSSYNVRGNYCADCGIELDTLWSEPGW